MGSFKKLGTVSALALSAVLAVGCGDDDSFGAGNPTPTPVATDGPVITFFGLTRADDVLIEPSGDENGVPVYNRPTGSGHTLVVEARRGPSGEAVGQSSYDPDLSGYPDLQIQVSRSLGNGSSTVCDDPQANPGGVPGVKSGDFDGSDKSIAAVNDLACRFLDGAGAPTGRTSSGDSCVRFDTGDFAFVNPTTEVQFCGAISVPTAFKKGDTLVTVRVRDFGGSVGPEEKLIVRVAD